MSRYPYRQSPHPLAGSNSERQSVGDPGHCEDCCSVGHVVAHPDLGCGDVGCDVSHEADLPQTLESLLAVAGELLRTYTAPPIDPVEYEALKRELATSRGMNTELRQDIEVLRQEIWTLRRRNLRQFEMLRQISHIMVPIEDEMPTAAQPDAALAEALQDDAQNDAVAQHANLQCDLKSLARNVVLDALNEYPWSGGDHSNHTRADITTVAADALIEYGEGDIRFAEQLSKLHELKSKLND